MARCPLSSVLSNRRIAQSVQIYRDAIGHRNSSPGVCIGSARQVTGFGSDQIGGSFGVNPDFGIDFLELVKNGSEKVSATPPRGRLNDRALPASALRGSASEAVVRDDAVSIAAEPSTILQGGEGARIMRESLHSAANPTSGKSLKQQITVRLKYLQPILESVGILFH